MNIRRHRDSRSDASIQLSEIDTGIRQCLQLLMACEAVKEQGNEIAKAHWIKMAERAWRDFEEDRQLVSGDSGNR